MRKTILITGSTDGIGLATAQNLASAGHNILLHGRNADKLEATKTKIEGQVETYLADLSDMGEVEKLASAVLSAHEKLDILINNAGVYKTSVTKIGGKDVRFLVNTFAPLILTRRLLPIIPGDGRVVNLSSAAQAEVEPDVLRGLRDTNDFNAYAQSKLALIIWTQELARNLPEGPVVVAVNPGSLLASKMVKEGFGLAGNDLSIGADILCSAALDAAFSAVSGKYFDNDVGQFIAPHASLLTPGYAQDIMRVMDNILTDL
ncbi:SDR family NAD(P)-dependent oxidoreductase [Thalassospira lucentensis]|uniref:SDR family NAD(P)-dependent oxidoreductase n=1 Tax=Thalassospira lucentensis TaxID=168935 RepID=UPI003D2EF6D4